MKNTSKVHWPSYRVALICCNLEGDDGNDIFLSMQSVQHEIIITYCYFILI